MISNDWLPALQEEFHKDYYKKLFTFVKDEYSKHVVYPPSEDIFNALRKKNIFVRYFKKPRIDNYLRITVGTDEEMDAMIDFLKKYLA